MPITGSFMFAAAVDADYGTLIVAVAGLPVGLKWTLTGCLASGAISFLHSNLYEEWTPYAQRH